MTLGVALLEKLPRTRYKGKTIYQMLALLLSCLRKSPDTKEFARGMNFNLNRYKRDLKDISFASMEMNANNFYAPKMTFDHEDSFVNILQNIEQIVYPVIRI
jgi:hypothetical protein